MRAGCCWLGNLGHQSHRFLGRDTYLTQNLFYINSECAVGNFGHQSHLFLGQDTLQMRGGSNWSPKSPIFSPGYEVASKLV